MFIARAMVIFLIRPKSVIPFFKSVEDEENFCEFGCPENNKNIIYAKWLRNRVNIS